MAQIPNCPECKNFVFATDPQIVKAYAGQCTKLEWPYTVNIPRVDGISGECGFYEGAGKPMVDGWKLADAGAAAGAKAAADTSVTKVEFYFDSSVTPTAGDNAAVLDLMAKLVAKGVDAKTIDLKGQPNPAKAYNAACTGPKADIRGVYGAKGALEEDFGRTVPALLVYGKDANYPRAVFPRSDKQLQRLLGPAEALGHLLK